MIEPNVQPRHGIAWMVTGVLALLLFTCLFGMAGLYYFARTGQDSAARTVRPALSTISTIRPVAAASPQPIVQVTMPEAGIDYESAILINIYAQVNPSVVNVTVLQSGAFLEEIAPSHSFGEDQLVPVSSGSGFVWDADGHIVTNHHVVEGADQVQITFSDGTMALAEVIGVDPDSDLAVLKIDPTGYALTPIKLGNLDEVRVGMRVAAIGNPFGLEGTLTSGIVSAIGRSIPARVNFSIPSSIQTDAAINPGNSGGPLLNERGEVIGVNAQIRSEREANSGVGFAIPVSIVARVAPALIADGVYQHSYIGVSGATLSPICAADLGLPRALRGAYIDAVFSATPAAKAGLRAGETPSATQYATICPQTSGGDVILALNEQPIIGFDDVLVYLERYTSPGDTVTFQVLRGNEELLIDVTLAARPDRLAP
ncbi:MAG: trypsin-like peptidase domain-containing protein [Chloroflexota bacterium]|nr:trypsin-like peptidase domain-containing protein [Chloroflexota bacterium]